MSAKDVDLVNRDPNSINDHVQVAFEDIIAEPDGAHSPDCVWKLAHTCFSCSRNVCYSIAAIFCGCPLAICWGCEFAGLAFNHVWLYTPCYRAFVMDCGMCQKFFGTCLQCCFGPICETCGLFFSNIVVKKH
ncbi:hypothetical protein BaRGS_00012633 [Batillaria attramentaria]|uniref:Caveolin n=1 Tax=Batillaria attramentaria TaxID=370345 RepID=A0ABD0LA30_9CAEN